MVVARKSPNSVGRNSDPMTNLIDVHINRLAQSLTPVLPADSSITKRGKGYMLASTEQSQQSDDGDCQAGDKLMTASDKPRTSIFSSMRIQLTFWYTAVLAIVLLIFAVTT